MPIRIRPRPEPTPRSSMRRCPHHAFDWHRCLRTGMPRTRSVFQGAAAIPTSSLTVTAFSATTFAAAT
eukprot:scaffold112553_cov19-Phaeocystis_antarctica.AAC.1